MNKNHHDGLGRGSRALPGPQARLLKICCCCAFCQALREGDAPAQTFRNRTIPEILKEVQKDLLVKVTIQKETDNGTD